MALVWILLWALCTHLTRGCPHCLQRSSSWPRSYSWPSTWCVCACCIHTRAPLALDSNHIQLVSLSDLQGDAINPIDMCNQLNNLVLPEVGLHGFLTTVYLLTGHWFEVLINLPLVLWHAYRCVLHITRSIRAAEPFRRAASRSGNTATTLLKFSASSTRSAASTL